MNSNRNGNWRQKNERDRRGPQHNTWFFMKQRHLKKLARLEMWNANSNKEKIVKISGFPNSSRQSFEDSARAFQMAFEMTHGRYDGYRIARRVGSNAANVDIEESDLDFSIDSEKLVAMREKYLRENRRTFTAEEWDRKSRRSSLAFDCLVNFKELLEKNNLLCPAPDPDDDDDCSDSDDASAFLYFWGEIIGGASPVLVLWEVWTNRKIDIVFKGRDAEENTGYLRSYGESNKKFPPLCRAMKKWAGNYNVTGAKNGFLNCLSLSLMVITFLKKFPEMDQLNLQDVFFKMVKFYSDFDFENMVINAREGDVFRRPENCHFKSNRQDNEHHAIVVADPFDHYWNCAATVRHRETAEHIIKQFKRLLQKMSDGKVVFNFDEDLEPVIVNKFSIDPMHPVHSLIRERERLYNISNPPEPPLSEEEKY